MSSSLFGQDGTDQSAAACTSLSLHGARRITESNYGMLARTITESEVGNRGCGGARQRQSMIPNVKIQALKLHYTDCTYFNPSILRVFKVELVLLLSGPALHGHTHDQVLDRKNKKLRSVAYDPVGRKLYLHSDPILRVKSGRVGTASTASSNTPLIRAATSSPVLFIYFSESPP